MKTFRIISHLSGFRVHYIIVKAVLSMESVLSMAWIMHYMQNLRYMRNQRGFFQSC
mgnify:CR=1 FL=1